MEYVLREYMIGDEAELGQYPELLRSLLFSRGIKDRKSAETFLNPDYELHTHDPFLMKGMEKAVSRILSAIRLNERIVIYSDYDADGVPGGVILYDFFKKIGYNNFSNYIPHRHDEGFGLNHDAIDEFIKDGVELLITVDCGVADVQEVAHAQKGEIDVIVTDHHLPGSDGVPESFAVLDPKQADCLYPFKELCGTGVAFKLIQALLLRMPSALSGTSITLPVTGWEKWLLDMVGLATLSDMVPLVGENRVFAYFGLKVLRKSPRPGLQKLLRKAGVNQRSLTEDDVVFSVTPKINAASRLGSADVAFRLLSTADETEADVAVEELLHLNNERKGIVGGLVKEIKKIIAERYAQGVSVIVVGNPEWRPSLLGLVANSLVREHACPVFLWGRDGDDVIKGSCRSDGQVSVMNLMTAARDAFVEYGGHAFSGGFTVAQDKIHSLEESLRTALLQVNSKKIENVSVEVDKTITPDDVSIATYHALQKLAPFGQGNAKPIFLMKNVPIHQVRFFGKEKNHMEVLFKRNDGSLAKAISFFAEGTSILKEGEPISLLCSLEQSSFGGRTELRLRIVAIGQV